MDLILSSTYTDVYGKTIAYTYDATGNLTRIDYAHEAFANLSSMFDVRFLIPENAQFGTVIGTALGGISK